MKIVLFFFFVTFSSITAVHACTNAQSLYKMYVMQDESSEFCLELPENLNIIGEAHHDEQGYFVYLEEVVPKAFRSSKKFYCRCGGKFFRRSAFLRHRCPYNRSLG